MTIRFTPDTLTLTISEYQEFTLSVVCEDFTAGEASTPPDPETGTGGTSGTPDEIVPLNVVSATCADMGIVITFEDNVFTIEPQSKFVDAFARVIKYTDLNDVSFTVSSFSELPEQFHALYSYVAPSAMTSIMTIDVLLQQDGEVLPPPIPAQYQITVTNNWALANSQLVTQVIKGDY